MRELRLVFGATTASVAAVLAVFMAGLGVGGAVLGKWIDRAANPLAIYGLLEVAISICVAASPWLVGLASSVYIDLGGQAALGLAGATAVRLLLTVFVMAVPTFLMGGTLPAAVRSVTGSGDAHRRALGLLYGSNTLGAVFGAAVATFFALEFLGTRATLLAGCAISLMAGAIAVLRARALESIASHSERSGPETSAGNVAPNDSASSCAWRCWASASAALLTTLSFAGSGRHGPPWRLRVD
jgi:hypothetical protein